VAKAAAASGAYDTVRFLTEADTSAVECGMDAVGAAMAFFDPMLGLSPEAEYLYNLFGLGWAFGTPEGGSPCQE